MEKSTQGGVGICGLLFIVFLVLKLTQVIDWSWWWVSAPLWIPFAIVLLIVIVSIISAVVKIRRTNRRR